MEWVQGHLLTAIIASGGLGWAASKVLPWVVKKYIGSAIEDAYSRDTGDPVEKELRDKALLSNMAYLEYIMPDRGQGGEKKAVILEKFGPKVGPIIEELMESLDDLMKATLARHDKEEPK